MSDEELEAKITQAITDLYLSIPAHVSDREYRFDRAAGPILRAFAREILQPRAGHRVSAPQVLRVPRTHVHMCPMHRRATTCTGGGS